MTLASATDTDFESLDPADGSPLGSYPVHGEAEVGQAVARAREAAAWWRAQGPAGRRRHLRA